MAENIEEESLVPNAGVGQRLKQAREAAGYSLAQMAERTKIPARMLGLIEAGNFAALPARTYATGFTRSYARQLGLDEHACVAEVRAELGMNQQAERMIVPAFEPGDPSRVPSARFAWAAAVAALVVVAAGLFFWRTYYAPAVSLPSVLPDETASAAAPLASPAVAVSAAPVPAPVSTLPSPTDSLAPQALARSGDANASGVRAPAPRNSPAALPESGAGAPAPDAASTAQN